jgi:hypothetical protein
MATSIHDPVSAEPADYKFQLAGAEPIAAREQVSPPSQPPNEHEESPPSDADVHSFPPDHDPRWDVFLPDDDEIDPLPEPGDFWVDDD